MKQLLIATTALVLLSACGKEETPPPPLQTPPANAGPRPEKMPNGEPAVITVKHVLISFQGAGTKATRSREEAQKLAYDVLNRAKSGEDFDKLMKELSDDSPDGGTYTLVNNGIAKQGEEYERTGMVPAFGNVGFIISVNEIGLAEHDAKTSPYGWHVIKRVK